MHCSSTGAPLDQQITTAMHETFPGWRIRHRPDTGMWSAVRTTRPTPTQRAAGLNGYIIERTPEAMAEALAHQSGIAARVRR